MRVAERNSNRIVPHLVLGSERSYHPHSRADSRLCLTVNPFCAAAAIPVTKMEEMRLRGRVARRIKQLLSVLPPRSKSGPKSRAGKPSAAAEKETALRGRAKKSRTRSMDAPRYRTPVRRHEVQLPEIGAGNHTPQKKKATTQRRASPKTCEKIQYHHTDGLPGCDFAANYQRIRKICEQAAKLRANMETERNMSVRQYRQSHTVVKRHTLAVIEEETPVFGSGAEAFRGPPGLAARLAGRFLTKQQS